MIARELLEKLCENLIQAFELDCSILEEVDDVAFMKIPDDYEAGIIITKNKDLYQFFIITIKQGKVTV